MQWSVDCKANLPVSAIDRYVLFNWEFSSATVLIISKILCVSCFHTNLQESLKFIQPFNSAEIGDSKIKCIGFEQESKQEFYYKM